MRYMRLCQELRSALQTTLEILSNILIETLVFQLILLNCVHSSVAGAEPHDNFIIEGLETGDSAVLVCKLQLARSDIRRAFKNVNAFAAGAHRQRLILRVGVDLQPISSLRADNAMMSPSPVQAIVSIAGL